MCELELKGVVRIWCEQSGRCIQSLIFASARWVNSSSHTLKPTSGSILRTLLAKTSKFPEVELSWV